MFAKEEELAEFQAKLGEREAALKAYKTENSRFADMKDKFKADIGSLQLQVNTIVTVVTDVGHWKGPLAWCHLQRSNISAT